MTDNHEIFVASMRDSAIFRAPDEHQFTAQDFGDSAKTGPFKYTYFQRVNEGPAVGHNARALTGEPSALTPAKNADGSDITFRFPTFFRGVLVEHAQVLEQPEDVIMVTAQSAGGIKT